MMHLFSGATWIGGLAGLLLITLPGAVPSGDRGDFWASAVRRFSVLAMSSVAGTALSGLFLYGSTSTARVSCSAPCTAGWSGVKILIFGTLLLLGMANQFWLHPRIEALRAAGDQRGLRQILVTRFPAVIAVELLLGMTVLFVAPFLSGLGAQPGVPGAAVGLPQRAGRLAAEGAAEGGWRVHLGLGCRRDDRHRRHHGGRLPGLRPPGPPPGPRRRARARDPGPGRPHRRVGLIRGHSSRQDHENRKKDQE